MKNQKAKKTIKIATIASIIAVMTAGGAFAYFSSRSETKVNTFTITEGQKNGKGGQINEPDWDNNTDPNNDGKHDDGHDDDGDGVPDIDEMTPDQFFVKDPSITNTTQYDAWAFIKIDVPVAQAVLNGQDTKEYYELVSVVPTKTATLPNGAGKYCKTDDVVEYNTKKASDGSATTAWKYKNAEDAGKFEGIDFDDLQSGNAIDKNYWQLVAFETDPADGYHTYVYAYNTTLNGNPEASDVTKINVGNSTNSDTTVDLFDVLQIKNFDKIEDGKAITADVKVTGYLVQDTGFKDPATAYKQLQADNADDLPSVH